MKTSENLCQRSPAGLGAGVTAIVAARRPLRRERSTRERTFGSSPVTALRHRRAPELARAAPPSAVKSARHAAATAHGPAVHAIASAGQQIGCCTGAARAAAAATGRPLLSLVLRRDRLAHT